MEYRYDGMVVKPKKPDIKTDWEILESTHSNYHLGKATETDLYTALYPVVKKYFYRLAPRKGIDTGSIDLAFSDNLDHARKMLIKYSKFRVSFRGMVIETIRNKYFDWDRKESRRITALTLTDNPVADRIADPSTLYHKREINNDEYFEQARLTILNEAPIILKGRMLEVFMLKFVQGYDHDKISYILGISKVASRNALSHAIKKLRIYREEKKGNDKT